MLRDPSTETSYRIDGLQPGTEYRFRVAAHNTEGTGSFSDAVSATTLTTIPSAPRGLNAIPSAHSVALSWDAPVSNGGVAITDYRIEYVTSGSEDWSAVEREPSVSTNFTIDGLEPNTTYRLRVAALNAEGKGGYSNEIQVVTLVTVPSAPRNLTAEPAHETVRLTWQAPASSGGTAITDYRVEYSLKDSDHWTAIEREPSADTSFTVEHLYQAAPYRFRVTAVNSHGVGPASSVIEATPIPTPTLVTEEKGGELTETSQRQTLPKRPTFSGVTVPLSKVVVTVRSDPITCETTADSEGKWSCTLPDDLLPGNHTVYVAVTLPDDSVREMGPYPIKVDPDRTPEPVTDTTPPASSSQRPPATTTIDTRQLTPAAAHGDSDANDEETTAIREEQPAAGEGSSETASNEGTEQAATNSNNGKEWLLGLAAAMITLAILVFAGIRRAVRN